MEEDPTLTSTHAGGGDPLARVPALTVLWSTNPGQVGEVALLSPTSHGSAWVLGRGAGDEGLERVRFVRLRPPEGVVEPGAGVTAPHVSRRQLLLSLEGELLRVRNIGRCPLRVNGQECGEAQVDHGDLLELHHQLVLRVSLRTLPLRPWPDGLRWPEFPFGQADAYGLVGESPAMWELRRAIFFAGHRSEHVLVSGPTGSGKELVARAVHAVSPRGARAMVDWSAAAVRSDAADRQLFGEGGVVRRAQGSSLLLDEVARLQDDAVDLLLRVLDTGELPVPGTGRTAPCDFRCIAVTSRAEDLPPALGSRFGVRIQVPGLADRVEDIPLLAADQVRRMASTDRDLAARFCFAGGAPRIAPHLVTDLVRGSFPANVRDVVREVIAAVGASASEVVGGTSLGGREQQRALPPAPSPVFAEDGDTLFGVEGEDTEAIPLQDGVVDLRRRTVRRGEVEATLTRIEHALVHYLYERKGTPVPHAELLVAVWGYKPDTVTHTVQNAVRRLRVKVERDPSNPRHIVSVYGIGYRFDP